MAVEQTKPDFIYQAITSAIQKETSRLFEEHKKRMIEELDRDKDIIISGIVLHVAKSIEMQTMKDHLIVTIRELKT